MPLTAARIQSNASSRVCRSIICLSHLGVLRAKSRLTIFGPSGAITEGEAADRPGLHCGPIAETRGAISRLGVHSRYGLHTRAVTVYRDTLTRGFSHFVTSMTAPVASGWSGCRVGLTPTGKRRLSTVHANNRHAQTN